MDLCRLAVDLRSGALTPLAHVRDVLARMDALAGTPYANLVVARDDLRALADATALEAGVGRGPLHGVAVAVKDNIDVEGLPTRAGSHIYDDAGPARADAPVVARLRAAGAVVVAKTHMHELAYGPAGDVSADGPAVHPRDPTRITGGSSSGSAALVALGVVGLALGTDTGCSVRTPAALCGVVGLKPTLGALPTAGVVPLSTTLDHVGILTADVASAAAAWAGLTADGAGAPDLDGLRIGLPRGEALAVDEPEIDDAVAAGADRLRGQGVEVVGVALRGVEELVAAYAVVVGSEAYATHADALAARPGAFQPGTAARLRVHAHRSAQDYLDALRVLQRRRAAILDDLRSRGVDALLLATTPVRAAPVDAVGPEMRRALLRLGIPFSVLGLPAVSVPAPGVAGLPIGLQVVGVRLAEPGVLAVAAALE